MSVFSDLAIGQADQAEQTARKRRKAKCGVLDSQETLDCQESHADGENKAFDLSEIKERIARQTGLKSQNEASESNNAEMNNPAPHERERQEG